MYVPTKTVGAEKVSTITVSDAVSTTKSDSEVTVAVTEKQRLVVVQCQAQESESSTTSDSVTADQVKGTTGTLGDNDVTVVTVPAKSQTRVLTKQEVAKHTTRDDCWVIVDNKVLDLTRYLRDHPGGMLSVQKRAGGDATE